MAIRELAWSRADDCINSSAPGDLLDFGLQVFLGAPDIDHRGIQRVVAHDLGESMEWHACRHPIPESMAQIVWADIAELCLCCVLLDEMAKCALRERLAVFSEGKSEGTSSLKVAR